MIGGSLPLLALALGGEAHLLGLRLLVPIGCRWRVRPAIIHGPLLVVLLRPGKIDVVHHELNRRAVVAVLILILPRLAAGMNHSGAPLAEVLADELRRLAPRGKGEPVRRAVAVGINHVPVNRHAETCHLLSRLGGPQFRISGKPPLKITAVQHRSTSLLPARASPPKVQPCPE